MVLFCSTIVTCILKPRSQWEQNKRGNWKFKMQVSKMILSWPPSTVFRLCRVTASCPCRAPCPRNAQRCEKKEKKNWDPQRCKNRYTKPLSGLRSGQPTKQNQKRMPILVCSNKWFTATRCQPNCSLSHSSHILNASKPVVFWMPQRIWCFEIQNVRCVFKYLMNLDNVLCPYL